MKPRPYALQKQRRVFKFIVCILLFLISILSIIDVKFVNPLMTFGIYLSYLNWLMRWQYLIYKDLSLQMVQHCEKKFSMTVRKIFWVYLTNALRHGSVPALLPVDYKTQFWERWKAKIFSQNAFGKMTGLPWSVTLWRTKISYSY